MRYIVKYVALQSCPVCCVVNATNNSQLKTQNSKTASFSEL